ncbi:hypothetical protein N7492_001739 [Penicillium capsulatum]|uniref:Extracellular protein n=1 Tax=Penicillium capsulatum TaxID=69766 RepID=A0A9W9IS30_9EURO|nr:hypothetical protein N7492_001739 [Penicillium capsulatum]KAJ6129210.1 hypothetical protein N7512_001990 [Penicillium capsulatum]
MKGIAVLASLLATTATAHMQMSKPYPIRSPLNKEGKGEKDYSYTNPLESSGQNYPCKGYAKDEFDSQADYAPGQSYEMELEGSATHDGGSCQLALTYDRGETFKVIESMLGDCPKAKKYKFEIPSDAPSGEALLAWSWFNKVGNREMYMNCAMVTIGGAGHNKSESAVETTNHKPAAAKPHEKKPAANKDAAHAPMEKQHAPKEQRDMNKKMSFDSLPELFVANVNQKGKCTTIEGEAVNFPKPGDHVIGEASGKGYKCEGDAPFLGDSNRETSKTENQMSKVASAFGTSTAESRAQDGQSVEASTNHAFSSYVGGWHCTNGEILCAPDGLSWAMCSNGRPIYMGAVAAGMVCRMGHMVAAHGW